MKIGARVIVVASWSSFYGARGVVTQMTPYLEVHLDGERLPMRIEGVIEESPTPEVSMTGAE